MKQDIIRKACLGGLLTVVLTAFLFVVFSCADEFEKTNKGHNLTLSTRAGETAALQMPSMRLFTFYNGTSADMMFYKEILNITRSANQLTAQVEEGQWNMALVSNPDGGTIIPPVPNTLISEIPLYKYEPVYAVGAKTTNAHEMYLDNQLTPPISASTPATMPAQLNRTVARVDLIIKKATQNFDLSVGAHTIKLHNIPSTISYTGALLPSAAAPDTLARALESPVTLVNAGDGSYKGTETITFIIPAHRGDAYTTATPIDVVGVKMDISLDFLRSGGSRFVKQEQIQVVAQCNKILQVEITINDGIVFETSVLNWEGVDVNSTIGAGYQNWLYVKQGVHGNGLSWSDPLPDINTAITQASALLDAGKTVNGILVAGGSALTYNEGFTVPDGVKIYGGWKGEPRTELVSTATPADLYASADRNLKTYKARVVTGAGGITLSGTNAVLDGFIVEGQGSSSSSGLVTVSDATAWINAVEIDKQTGITAANALAISAGTGTNILVSRNNKGVSLSGTGTLVNATIARNTAASTFNGVLYNTVYWGNSGTAALNGTIKYCAFEGDNSGLPVGTNQEHNYPLHDTNDAWFTTSNILPGPRFDLGATLDASYFEVGTTEANRSPMLGRGDQTIFDTAVSNLFSLDINGNSRVHLGIDIGCYENSANEGFKLRWASERVYIAARPEYASGVPLLLPDNELYNIGVSWDVTVIKNATGASSTLSFSTLDTSTASGSGTGVLVGSVNISPTATYTAAAERYCGAIKVHTKLGAYLPDEEMAVYQTPGASFVWYQGYVGSFHRNNERGARYICGTNTGNWSVRIISGHEWIKIDANEKGYGDDITGEVIEHTGSNYKEVEEVFGGAFSGNGNIKFRVGMKSTLPAGSAPRYGLIIITRSGGAAMFFVRQGEEPDYLYRSEDVRTVGTGNRNNIKKFSTFSLKAQGSTIATTGQTDDGSNGATWVSHPTKIGDFYQWGRTVAYRRGVKTGTLSANTVITSAYADATHNPCPSGYRHGTIDEWIETLYMNAAITSSGVYQRVVPDSDAARLNFVYGRYADGYYDQLAPAVVSADTDILGSATGYGISMMGVLMVNHYNYGAIFFPAAGVMPSGNATSIVATGGSGYCAMYHTSTVVTTGTVSGRVSSVVHNSHWYGGTSDSTAGGHIGMTCTQINGTSTTAALGNYAAQTNYSHAAPVRCVKIAN